MESVDGNMVIDLIKNKKLSYNETSEVLRGVYPRVRLEDSAMKERYHQKRQ